VFVGNHLEATDCYQGCLYDVLAGVCVVTILVVADMVLVLVSNVSCRPSRYVLSKPLSFDCLCAVGVSHIVEKKITALHIKTDN